MKLNNNPAVFETLCVLYLAGGELECVEVRDENFGVLRVLSQGSKDLALSRAALGVQEHNLEKKQEQTLFKGLRHILKLKGMKQKDTWIPPRSEFMKLK